METILGGMFKKVGGGLGDISNKGCHQESRRCPWRVIDGLKRRVGRDSFLKENTFLKENMP